MRFGAFQAVKDVSFSLAEGEALGIVGPNGAGKTTLFSLIAGSLTPSAGSISLASESLVGKDAAARCLAGIGRTHQVPRPFLGMTVFENALVAAQHGSGLPAGAAERGAAEALTRTGLSALANRPAAALGLLDRKRLELARALATAPRVLLLDEIGGGLTEAELITLVGLISELKADGLSIIWIEHILHALLKVIDRLICMSVGEIIAEGDPQAVMRDPSVMAAYLGGIEEHA
ncbi:branched-chain amino acid transport system ATP-binding protein [Peteryoungia aggregata LMG 23059]|uniref:Branched-chain amino acid transport system ATP-binding protein n=1 Tax=Peteryoungia aggregata LMG 23059 TaxID=1368425 RepID=A0ABU0G7T4_9HYPH|nr:ATP-binding cassette domain-containing protein [Peteryoungia aggregata]MDQ0420742.1 branched-chain amino acid transport system ATP-binding protein [Peteryoungia aggregata LMG 23059]